MRLVEGFGPLRVAERVEVVLPQDESLAFELESHGGVELEVLRAAVERREHEPEAAVPDPSQVQALEKDEDALPARGGDAPEKRALLLCLVAEWSEKAADLFDDANQAAMSRLYAGIRYRSDNADGKRCAEFMIGKLKSRGTL